MHKPNNIATKLSLKVKLIFKVSQKKIQIYQFGPTWGIKNEAMRGKRLQGVTPLLQNFEINLMPIFFLLYFSSYRSKKN